MIGFKKVPTKLVIGIFFLLIALVLLLYLDLTSEQPPAEEEIAYSEAIEGAPLEVISQQTYEVKDGEILSIIFEKFKVPLNTQYKIYSLKEANLVTNIRPGNRIIFTYLGNELTNIAIVKDKLSSIEISIGQKIILNKVTNNIETISSYAGGTISSSFYEDASASGMPDSVIMDLAYIFGWDIDFVFDIRKGDTFSVIYETPYSKGEMVENGDILIAEFTNQNKTYVANRFIDQEGKKDLQTEK
jgi:LysM repeat protein